MDPRESSAEVHVMLKLKSPTNLALLSEGVDVTHVRLRPDPSGTCWALETNPPPREIKRSAETSGEGRSG